MNLACASCPVRDSAACAVLSEEDRASLARVGRTREIKRGETLFAAGDESTACATLISGALKICAFDSMGNEQILSLVHPSGFIGEMFSPFAHHDVVALTDSQLCTFARSDMDRAIEDYPELARALLRRREEDLHSTRHLLELTAHGTAEARLASLVYGFARAASDSPCHPAHSFELPLTRGEMANMLGLTIETVSRKLGELEHAGAITRKGKRGIELIDPAHLQSLSAA